LPSLKYTAPNPLLMCSNRFAAKGRGRRNQTAEHDVKHFSPFASCLRPPTLHILLPSLLFLLRAFVTQPLTFPTSYRARQTAESARPRGCSQSRSSDQGPLPNLHLPKPQTSHLKPQTSNLKPQTSNLKPQTLHTAERGSRTVIPCCKAPSTPPCPRMTACGRLTAR
jgi:hypothetical protein